MFSAHTLCVFLLCTHNIYHTCTYVNKHTLRPTCTFQSSHSHNSTLNTCYSRASPMWLPGKEDGTGSTMLTCVRGFGDYSALGATITIPLGDQLDKILIFLVSEDEVSGSNTFWVMKPWSWRFFIAHSGKLGWTQTTSAPWTMWDAALTLETPGLGPHHSRAPFQNKRVHWCKWHLTCTSAMDWLTCGTYIFNATNSAHTYTTAIWWVLL